MVVAFRLGQWPPVLVCLLALEIPTGVGPRECRRPEASAQAVALREADRRSQSEGQKANQIRPAVAGLSSEVVASVEFLAALGWCHILTGAVLWLSDRLVDSRMSSASKLPNALRLSRSSSPSGSTTS